MGKSKRAKTRKAEPAPLPFETPARLRAWFAKHAATERELWILYLHPGKSAK